MHDHAYISMIFTSVLFSGIARTSGKGVLEHVRAKCACKILATPTYELERSKFKLSSRTHSEGSYISYRANSMFSDKSWDKISF
jgi:hypothetical protein